MTAILRPKRPLPVDGSGRGIGDGHLVPCHLTANHPCRQRARARSVRIVHEDIWNATRSYDYELYRRGDSGVHTSSWAFLGVFFSMIPLAYHTIIIVLGDNTSIASHAIYYYNYYYSYQYNLQHIRHIYASYTYTPLAHANPTLWAHMWILPRDHRCDMTT